jgi:hypothetical protein
MRNSPSLKSGQARRLIIIAVAASLASVVLITSFAYADHKPAPHDIRIAVVGSAAVREHVALGLAHAAPGGFSISTARSPADAIAAIREQRSDGALVVQKHGPDQILTAGAAGPNLQLVIDKALTAVSGAMGRQTVSRDVVPLPDNDRSGLTIFVFELGLLVPSVLGSVFLFLVGRRARLWWRVGASALYCVLATALSILILNVVFGALTGAWAALFGIGVFGALSMVLTVSACQATFGLPGTGLAAFTLIFIGNAISGGSMPGPLLPNVYRQISEWTPNGAIVRGARAVVYFGGHGVGQPLIALGAWTAFALAALALNDWAHITERRTTSVAAEVYATPGIAHAASKLRRRRQVRTQSRAVAARGLR